MYRSPLPCITSEEKSRSRWQIMRACILRSGVISLGIARCLTQSYCNWCSCHTMCRRHYWGYNVTRLTCQNRHLTHYQEKELNDTPITCDITHLFSPPFASILSHCLHLPSILDFVSFPHTPPHPSQWSTWRNAKVNRHLTGQCCHVWLTQTLVSSREAGWAQKTSLLHYFSVHVRARDMMRCRKEGIPVETRAEHRAQFVIYM